MADTDLIACMYPIEGEDAFDTVRKNRSRYVGPPISPPRPSHEDEYRRSDRQPTEEPSHQDFQHLELRFSRGPQTHHGFVFGWDPNSDVVLPKRIGISFRHFALTFDEYNRPIVEDLGSLNGTQVTYDKQGHGKRRTRVTYDSQGREKHSNFRWIVGGHKEPQKKESIVIEIDRRLKFQIVVSQHDITSPLYIDNVNRFRQGTADDENLFGRLGLPPETERNSGTHTPGTGSIVLQKNLGEGAFGVVTHIWDVSTGDEYAIKEPSVKAIREKRVDVDAWKEEARIMGQISHEHIVKFLGKDFTTSVPRLYLEYLPGGALSDQEDITIEECTQILRQLLSALAYLHGLNPPILHRDIKSGNILVQYRYNGEINVKFGDFGLSKEERDSGHWTTICGTWLYVAPEIYKKRKYDKSGGRERKKYKAAIDIWSLGVVVFELLCELPRYKRSYKDQGAVWCEKIVRKFQKELEKRPDVLKEFLLDKMVIIDPELRDSAQDCHDSLFSTAEDRCQTPTPTSYAEDQQSMPHYPIEESDDEDQQTVLFQGAVGNYTVNSAEVRRYIRSGNPSPSSHSPISAAAGKRASLVSKSASSESRRTKRSKRSSPAARSSSHGQQDEFESELEQFYENAEQDLLNPLFVGSSLAELGQTPQPTLETIVENPDDSTPVLRQEWLLPPNWYPPPQDVPDSDPRLVGGASVYGQEPIREPIQVQRWAGRSWANGGRSWGYEGRSWGNGGRSWGDEEGVEDVCDGDDEVAAKLLLAIHEG